MNKDNFFIASRTTWVYRPSPDGEPDYISYYKGEVSSKYWFTYNGVYRESTHWGTVLFCDWPIVNYPNQFFIKKGPTGAVGDWFTNVNNPNSYTPITGYTDWEDFDWNILTDKELSVMKDKFPNFYNQYKQ